MQDRMPGSLQENILTLLVHSEEYGRQLAHIIDPTLFEGDYRVFGERAIDYWRRYSRPPGPHMPDLLSDVLESGKNDPRAAHYRAIIAEMLRLAESINGPYTVDRARGWVFRRRLQAGIFEFSKKLVAQEEMTEAEARVAVADLVRTRDIAYRRGVTLNDTDALIDFLRVQSTEFSMGIPELDARNIGPMRGAVMLLLAPTGVGKSWGLIHVAKRALMQRKKVYYASLEMSEGEVLMRFYQSFFSVADRPLRDADGEPLPFTVPTLEKDGRGRLVEITSEDVSPEFFFDSANLEDEVEVRRQLMEGKFANIEIKRYPTRQLTVAELRGDLDMLGDSGFVPDVLILDYIGIMTTDARDHRISLGRTFEDFRGLCAERNIAGVTAQQLNREAGKSARGGQANVAEDWSLAGTADVSISINATSAEKRRGLARLFVEKARRARDRFGMVITQSYDTGQFVIQSAPLDANYDQLSSMFLGGDSSAGEDE